MALNNTIYNVSVVDVIKVIDAVTQTVYRNPFPLLIFLMFTFSSFLFFNSFYDYFKDANLGRPQKKRLIKIILCSFFFLTLSIILAYFFGYLEIVVPTK